jgi:hypothetical protein
LQPHSYGAARNRAMRAYNARSCVPHAKFSSARAWTHQLVDGTSRRTKVEPATKSLTTSANYVERGCSTSSRNAPKCCLNKRVNFRSSKASQYVPLLSSSATEACTGKSDNVLTPEGRYFLSYDQSGSFLGGRKRIPALPGLASLLGCHSYWCTPPYIVGIAPYLDTG